MIIFKNYFSASLRCFSAYFFLQHPRRQLVDTLNPPNELFTAISVIPPDANVLTIADYVQAKCIPCPLYPTEDAPLGLFY